MRRVVRMLPLLALLAGCGETAAPAIGRQPPYFDVKKLLDGQIRQLSQRHAPVTKRVSLRDGTTETVRVPAVKWADELQIFFQADINKAALRGAYAIDSVMLPGGLLRRTYTRRPGHPNAPVAQLSVLSAGTEARELRATIAQRNTLFDAQKNLVLILKNNQLRSYEVRGRQKLVLFEALRYAAAGQVE